MRFRKLVLLTSTIMFVGGLAFAQTQPTPTPQPSDPAADEEKAKKQKEMDERVVQMLDQATADANGLRLPQNRAVVFAMAGDMYWKFDEKRARELFRNAGNELNSFNADLEKDQRDTTARNFGPPEQNDIRGPILMLIARHDAELAYQMLLQTRPQKLAEAMAKGPSQQPDARGGGGPNRGNFDSDSAQAAQETALEQQLAVLAAQNDPDAAIKMIKDSMANGVSSSVLPLLQNLYKKDDKKAGDLANDVVSNVVNTDLTKNTQAMNATLGFLQFATQPVAATVPATTTTPADKQFNFTDAQTKDLANKLVSTILGAPASAQMTAIATRAIPTLQKVIPEKVAMISQKIAESQKASPNAARGAQIQRLFDRNATPEDILAQIPKMTNDADKRVAYQAVAAKIGQVTDPARAQKLISQISDDAARATAQQQFDNAQVSRAAAAGKLEDARRLIGNLTDKRAQIQKLVTLALQFQKSGTEKDVASAKGLMRDAKALTPEVPEDEDDIADLMEVVRGYAVIEPETAFRLIEPVVDQFNDIVQATAVLSKYNKRDRTFKKGELVMKMNGNGGGFGGGGFGGGLLLFRYITQIQMLGKADLERMSLLSDRFGRGDTRTIVKLYVLQGFLAPPPRPPITSGPGPVLLMDL